MERTGELAWFRAELLRSVLHPFDFARSIAREHYGIAGVLVALISGVALAFAIDAMILTSKGFSLFDFLPQVIVDSVFLGLRLAITVAIVATVGYYAARLLRRGDLTLDQAFTAFSFALSPLLFAPVAVVLVLFGPELLPIVGALALLAVIRAIVGLAINLRALLPPALAVVLFVVMVATGALVMQDQISRFRFAGYAIAPQLVGDFTATPMAGTAFEATDFTITLPAGWRNVTSGTRGEAARYESDLAELRVARAGGVPLATADSYADSASIAERQGLENAWRERSVVRINGVVAVDDRYGGIYQGRRMLYRQFTAVPRTQGLALVFRYVEPADEQAALAEAASIAATWHIREQSR
ncbi:MAG TPA: Yip1 family protein [Candidatus Limnocylindria bacterium]|nr:Yip1 family protein [Candidatus Limnocylindria bacterium]